MHTHVRVITRTHPRITVAQAHACMCIHQMGGRMTGARHPIGAKPSSTNAPLQCTCELKWPCAHALSHALHDRLSSIMKTHACTYMCVTLHTRAYARCTFVTLQSRSRARTYKLTRVIYACRHVWTRANYERRIRTCTHQRERHARAHSIADGNAWG
jgi:hypothetical protein